MSVNEYEQTLIDESQPNAGRVYDYFLDGNHNFKVDREMGEQLVKKMPFIKILAKLIRWFLIESVEKAVTYGFAQFLDFASGLPTKDHIHSNVPEGTKVLYSDIDPITVRTGQKIIGDNPNVKYMHCDVTEPEKVLESDIIKDLFGSNHHALIGLNGIFWFLTDEQISYSLKKIYDWADKGSMLYFCDGDSGSGGASNEFQALLGLYKSMNQPIYLRSRQTLCELVKPWTLEEPGLQPLDVWLHSSNTMTEKTKELLGGGHEAIGGYLRK